MKTIKTAVVVVLLLAVLYGLYTVLNKPEGGGASDTAWPQTGGPLQIETGAPAAPGDLFPMPGRELAERADSDPPDMPASIPSALGGEFNAADHELPPAKSGLAKRPPVQSVSGYAKTGESRTGDSSYVQPAGASQAARSLGTRAFADAWRAAARQISEGRHRQALAGLSIFYDSPDLSPEQERQLLDALDPLAGKVIYSTEHLLENPYDVRKGDNLYEVAKQYNVPWLLLKNVNGVDDPEILLPGTRLKVIRGPFRAEVKLVRAGQGELTLFLGDMYAGRFPVTIGNDQSVLPGQYKCKKNKNGPLTRGRAVSRSLRDTRRTRMAAGGSAWAANCPFTAAPRPATRAGWVASASARSTPPTSTASSRWMRKSRFESNLSRPYVLWYSDTNQRVA